MIYDVFLFNNEFDLLDLRLAELSGVVDKFVICESNVSMRGKAKPLHFWERRGEYNLNRIVHVAMPARPYQESRAVNAQFEHDTRSYLGERLDPILNPDDTVIFGDADEISRAEVVREYRPEQGVTRLGFQFYYYYFNLEVNDHEGHKLNHFRPVIGSAVFFKKLGFNFMRWAFPAGRNVIDHAGWHFSFLGGYDALMRKIASHAEGASSDWLLNEKREVIEQRIAEGKLWNGNGQYTFVPVDETFPKAIRDGYEKYVKLGYIKPV